MELRRALFVSHPRPAAVATAERGLAWCRQNGLEARIHTEDVPIPAGVDLVVAVGGDGTLLRAARLLYPEQVPLLAVNAGGLGFLSACDGGAIEGALAAVRAGAANVERRARLLVEGPGLSTSALNDVAIVGPDAERFTEVEVAAGGERVLAVEGDGLIVATPTGSTAYALAAGGPIVAPDVRALLIVPLAPHRLGLRPVVLAAETTVSVRACGPAQVLADGDPVRALAAGEVVRVSAAPAATALVRLAETGLLFPRLRDKLGWPA